MTYEELKNRLTKCEVKLKQLQKEDAPGRNSKNYIAAVEKLTLLKESYQKLIKEAEKGIIYTDDERKAQDLASKGSNVKLTKEQEVIDDRKKYIRLLDMFKTLKKSNVSKDSEQYKELLGKVKKAMDKIGIDSKHIKEMTDQEFYDAQEAERLEKHPEKSTIEKIRALIAAQQKREEMAPDEEDLYQHDDEYVAQLKRKKAKDESIFDTPRMGGFHSSKGVAGHMNTYSQDKAYADSNRKAREKDDETKKENATPEEEEKFHKKLDTLVHKTFGKRKEELEEAPIGKSYIKVAVRDARKALAIIDDSPAYSKAVEMDGSDTYYLADEQLAYDLLMDFGAHGIEVTDNNIDLDEASDYAKRRAAERDYQPAKKDAPAKKFKEPKNDYFARRKSELDYKYGSAGQEMYENEAEDEGGDLDIGHQDDEPDMLKQQVYDIATYAAKLYKILDKYDQYDGEVDFPHWWQKKVILARDYISAAQHYLEFEEKQPAIDALALEENTQKASYNKLKKEYDALVGKMKQLAQHFKTAEGENKVKIVAALKQHTARKRELESLIDKIVSGVGVGQELDPDLSEKYSAFKNYDEIVGGIQVRFGALEDYVQEKEPEAMDDLQKVVRAFEIFDEKMAYGAHEELEEDHTGNPNDKYVVRPCKAKDEPWAVWEGEKRIKGFKTKSDAQAYADKKNKEQGLNEAKATCCGKCGRVHVKGTECKKPYLSGKKHCRYN